MRSGTEQVTKAQHRDERQVWVPTSCHDSYDSYDGCDGYDGIPAGARPVVVVGCDGSTGSVAALRLAARDAAARGARLRIVHAYPAAAHHGPGRLLFPHVSDDGHALAQRVLQGAVDAAFGAQGPPGGTELAVTPGTPSDALVAAAVDAVLLVVGANGHSAGFRTMLGSTAQACAERAACPVLIASDGAGPGAARPRTERSARPLAGAVR